MRFFLDNCLPPRWAPALSALVKEEGHSVVHFSEKFPRSEPDAQWIAKLATEDQQIVIISGDERITRNPHERTAWKQAGLTAFFLASGWAHLKFWDKTWICDSYRIGTAASCRSAGTEFLIHRFHRFDDGAVMVRELTPSKVVGRITQCDNHSGPHVRGRG